MSRKQISLYILLLLGIILPAQTATAQKAALKTNLLYDATSTINLGVEFRLAPKWTLDLSANYNGWTLAKERKIKHWMVQPEARYWLCEPFNGHFFGLHALVSQFNMGGIKLPFNIGQNGIRNHRYEGWAAGGGLSYGYHWILGKRWGLEASIGVGYAYLDYDQFQSGKCGTKTGCKTLHYFGPTKAGITLIYMLK